MKQLIQEHLEYLENKEVFQREFYNTQLNDLVRTNNITVIEWQRRVGKSSLIVSYVKSNNIDLNNVFYINKEIDVLENISNSQDLQKAFDSFKENYQDPEYIIIDEVQDIEEWEKFIRKYHAYQKYKIIITWSNSSLLSGELSTYLTWRYVSLHIYPFSYKEFVEFNWYDKWEDSFYEYLEFGGMPEILRIDDKETRKNYLKNLVSDIVLKDVVARHNIRDIKLLEKLLGFLSDNLGSLVSVSNISNYTKNHFKKEYSLKTIANYLKYLEFAYIVNEIPRYDIKWKKKLEYIGKYYFSDIWIRNSFWFVFVNDIWKILENVVYLKLKQDGYEVFVWENNKYEVDFIAEKWGEKIYIQVCYMLWKQETVEREFGNLLNIKDNYKKIVLSLDKTFWNSFQWIENINIIDWLYGWDW